MGKVRDRVWVRVRLGVWVRVLGLGKGRVQVWVGFRVWVCVRFGVKVEFGVLGCGFEFWFMEGLRVWV